MTIVNQTPTLVEEIDKTAFKLLQKIGGDSNLTADQSTIFTEQVKAFAVVVSWAEKRESLVSKTKDSVFDGLKRDFHAVGAKTRGRGGRPPASGRSDSVIEFPGADTTPDTPAGE